MRGELELAVEKLVTTMMECEYYACICWNSTSYGINAWWDMSKVSYVASIPQPQVQLLGVSRPATPDFAALAQSLTELYANIVVYSVKAVEYFSQPFHRTKLPFCPVILERILTLRREGAVELNVQ